MAVTDFWEAQTAFVVLTALPDGFASSNKGISHVDDIGACGARLAIGRPAESSVAAHMTSCSVFGRALARVSARALRSRRPP